MKPKNITSQFVFDMFNPILEKFVKTEFGGKFRAKKMYESQSNPAAGYIVQYSGVKYEDGTDIKSFIFKVSAYLEKEGLVKVFVSVEDLKYQDKTYFVERFLMKDVIDDEQVVKDAQIKFKKMLASGMADHIEEVIIARNYSNR